MSNIPTEAPRWRLLEFRAIGDDRGWLTPLEQDREIPFAVMRTYVIYQTLPGISRGFHAHFDLEQVVICVSGRCRFLVDDGHTRQSYELCHPRTGLYIGPMVWREMHDFSPDCVLVVLASALYDENDYIRNYDEFRRVVSGGSIG